LSGIFINYRYDDAQFTAVLIEKLLVERFGREHVFRDDQLELGASFPEVLWRRLRQADVMLALIGPGWLNAEREGKRRLDDPQDFVRREIVHAFELGIPVVPILLDRTPELLERDLPEGMRRLATTQYGQIRVGTAEHDLHGLIDQLAAQFPSLLGSREPSPATAADADGQPGQIHFHAPISTRGAANFGPGGTANNYSFGHEEDRHA
jgi:hypothetical protein